MAIAADSTSQSSTSGTSLTFSHTCSGSNRILFVGVLGEVGSDVITGVTYNSVSMTLVDKALTPSDRYLYLFYLIAPATGANNIVVSASSSTYMQGTGVSYTGAKQTSPIDSSNTGTLTESGVGTSTFTVSTTVVADNCWLVGAVNALGATMSMGTGTTDRQIDYGTPGGIIDSNGTVSTGSQSLQVTTTPKRNMAMVLCSLAPSTATNVSLTLPTATINLEAQPITITKLLSIILPTAVVNLLAQAIGIQLPGTWSNSAKNNVSVTNSAKNNVSVTNQSK